MPNSEHLDFARVTNPTTEPGAPVSLIESSTNQASDRAPSGLRDSDHEFDSSMVTDSSDLDLAATRANISPSQSDQGASSLVQAPYARYAAVADKLEQFKDTVSERIFRRHNDEKRIPAIHFIGLSVVSVLLTPPYLLAQHRRTRNSERSQ